MSAIRRPASSLLPTLVVAVLMSGCGSEPGGQAATAARAATPAPAAGFAAPATESVAELMRRANAAFRAERIAAPAGDNAIELFLAVRAREPRHPGLAEALGDLMPLANFAFEGALRQGDSAEAERVLDLLARIDESSMVTRRARAQLAQLQQQIAAREAAAEEALQVATVAEAVRAAPEATTTEPAQAPARRAREDAATAAAPPIAAAALPAAGTAAPTGSPTATAAASEPAVAAATPSPLTAPRPIAKVQPDYPAQARSRKVEGFVELEFLVNTQGQPDEIRVVRSEPEGLFDRSAVRALMRWKFKPAERDGKVEAARTRTTLNFKLG
jgi:protein TonB